MYENIKTIKLINRKKLHIMIECVYARNDDLNFLVRVNGGEYKRGSLVYFVDYRIFCLGWESEDSKTGPEFYERNLLIASLSRLGKGNC